MNPLPPGRPFGRVYIPGSKSATNRALLLAAQCHGISKLQGGLEASDTRWMREILRNLRIPVAVNGSDWEVRGGSNPRTDATLWPGASGTTLRFLLPWLALQSKNPVCFSGEPRLFERPLAPLLQALEPLGVQWETTGQGGILHPVIQTPESLDLRIDASLSSQFLSGLALAAAGLTNGGTLRWNGTAASESYLNLTAHWLARFGCESHLETTSWAIPGSQLKAQQLVLPGDWSGAAAFLCAAAVTGRTLHVHPLDTQDAQGDRSLVEILETAGCQVAWDQNTLILSGTLKQGLHADLTRCPDLAPVLAATAALAPGDSVFTGLETLHMKECDRLDASAELVRWLGGQAEIVNGCALRIRPGHANGSRAPFDPRNDHRMAFAAAVGALRRGGDLIDPECVAKTFPSFWKTWDAMLDGLG